VLDEKTVSQGDESPRCRVIYTSLIKSGWYRTTQIAYLKYNPSKKEDNLQKCPVFEKTFSVRKQRFY